MTTETQDAPRTVIVECLQAALILYARWPGLTNESQDRPYHRLVDAAFRAAQNLAPRPQRGM